MLPMSPVIQTLKERGLIQQTSSEDLAEHLKVPRHFYLGIDPTADSLHIGNLVGLIVSRWLQMEGHTPIIVTGGATAKIGDPSGKSEERPLLSYEQVAKNSTVLKETCQRILNESSNAPLFLDNESWIGSFSFIDFLRDVGKHFRLGPMLAKEMVRTRLKSDEGLSFTEFSYQLLQGYDFAYLSEKHQVSLQIGGSDQWGNITAGIECGRRMKEASLFGLTHPLLLKSDGTKFGKSAGGAIWLSKEKLSVYHFYQYLIRTEDSDVIQMLRMLTFIPLDEIEAYEAALGQNAGAAQQRLAYEVTSLVHGDVEAKRAKETSELAAPGKASVLNEDSLRTLAGQIPTKEISKKEVIGKKLVDIIAESGIGESKGATRRLIQNRGLYLNDVQIEDPMHVFTENDCIGAYILLALGKKNKVILLLK